jgi:hypothetical protein
LYAKVTTSISCCTNLPHRGPHDFWCFISSLGLQTFCIFILWGIGFWMFRVFPFMLKNPFGPHCTCLLLVNECSHHISSQRYTATIIASLSLYNFTVLYISLININCVLLYICSSCYIYLINLFYIIGSLVISWYIYLLYFYSHFVLKIIWIGGSLWGFSPKYESHSPRIRGRIMKRNLKPRCD